MPALFLGELAARTEPSSRILEAKVLGQDGTSPLCEVMVAGHVMTGVYDSVRRALMIPCPVSAKLSDQPESVNALVCSCYPTVGAEPEYVVLLAAANGATVLLPREGASNASDIRVRPRLASDEASSADGSVVALARGPDPYATLLDATRVLADKTGVAHKNVYSHVLPLLDAVNRLRFDTSLKAAKANGKLSSTASLTSVLEQQLHEGILVQAGPGCPAKPLLQAPGLRMCQGMSAPLGVRYSGMSVVYGGATGHVLAVMDTASALKMAPGGVVRPLGLISPGRVPGDAESPSAVSAGASAATSAAQSPSMSRSNSSCGDAVPLESVTSLAASPPAAASRMPPGVLSGLTTRSITAAPIIQVQAAAPTSGAPVQATTPTGAPVQVLASFALLGVKTSGGRVGAVQCCRVMPASAALAAAPANGEEAAAAATVPAGGISGLGLVVQVEVLCASAGTLLLFVEGPEAEACADPSEGELDWEDASTSGGPVRGVHVQGGAARWRYNGTGGILSVELPLATAAAGAVREVQVFL
ncbi:hypothetical protein PLESTB_000063200 [Pleodorina starrii]|uniref:Uncharacterized protein n=1 Tax=Pleodorina starrii TaxID=330485 RepID=A0A9W6EXL7_9CHLO|nr:hypothetical protein PLESTM_001610300 [Pleodorina starrii]GLC48136.1 hypothetical protein PLESTB_000063200 [Pleodorina starrii]GLC67383.1 hypothetical protein PLESTF_000550300 [Pleodorina starrii]